MKKAKLFLPTPPSPSAKTKQLKSFPDLPLLAPVGFDVAANAETFQTVHSSHAWARAGARVGSVPPASPSAPEEAFPAYAWSRARTSASSIVDTTS